MRFRHPIRLAAVATGMVATLGWTQPAATAGPAASTTIRVSIATDGTQGNDISGRFSRPVISAGGRITAFDSIATTLVPGDANKDADVFVHDSVTGVTERVSVSSSGVEGRHDSQNPTIDGDGNLVAFDSSSKNLAPNDRNRLPDVFLHDRTTGETTRVSVAMDGGDANGPSFLPSISANGRYVAFVSDASNLVAQDTQGQRNIFVRDLKFQETELVSVANDGSLANSSSASPSISANGNVVAFASFASNLVPNDTNDQFDVFVRNRAAHTTVRASVATDGTQGDQSSTFPGISGNGRVVAFASNATTLIGNDTNGVQDVFLRTLRSGMTNRISVTNEGKQANGQSVGPGIRGGSVWGPSVNFDGSRIAFDSIATNMVPGDTDTCGPFYEETGRCPDVFVRDRANHATIRVSVGADGAQENDASTDPSIDASGLKVVFFSAASNLVLGDTNACPVFPTPGHCPDIFVNTMS
jgi:Tol biopolymer transport system component